MTEASNLRVEKLTMQMADLGPENPLPSVGASIEPPYRISADIPAEIATGARYGTLPNIYPHQLQDGYGRNTTARQVPAVILENSKIRAVFLPSLGGRLWELFDKERGKHLLQTQNRIQFANLGLRNAWFAGGIEWNIGTRGHSPTTCSPLHTAIVRTPEGEDVLRMWEFDRLREVVFQLDAWLPEDSSTVFVAVRIRNPNRHEVPMYWWSNAAVPESRNNRVVAPATEAFATDYDGGISRVCPDTHNGVDATWPARNPHAADFFFDLAPQQRRWIVNSDEDGDGLALVSSARLRGRKLFVWGQGAGGKRWQDWLSPGIAPYTEIQAGLAQTQFEHLVMPAGADWQWVEAYGNVRMDAGAAHNENFAVAVEDAEAKVERLVPAAMVASALSAAECWADMTPERHLLNGSGWGALEAARRQRSGMAWIDDSGTPFTAESIGPLQQPWLDLLAGIGKDGVARFAGAQSYVSGEDWSELLADAATPTGCCADALFHRAVIHHARQDIGAARSLYEASIRAEEQCKSEPRHASRALAHRGLGLIMLAQAEAASTPQTVASKESMEQETAPGLAELRAACALEPANLQLLAEALTLHLQHGQPTDALGLVCRAPEELAAIGRIRFLTALALARSGDPDRAAAILKAGLEVADLREGENSISALWLEVCRGEPVPPNYQFSMK